MYGKLNFVCLFLVILVTQMWYEIVVINLKINSAVKREIYCHQVEHSVNNTV